MPSFFFSTFARNGRVVPGLVPALRLPVVHAVVVDGVAKGEVGIEEQPVLAHLWWYNKSYCCPGEKAWLFVIVIRDANIFSHANQYANQF